MVKSKFFSRRKGFSLVELMIVVGIIGILATLAVPRFRAFQAKARQSEVKTTLNHIYTLQEVYAQEQNKYQATTVVYGRQSGATLVCDFTTGGAQHIGFRIAPCAGQLPRYGYSATSASAAVFTAKGESSSAATQGIYPGCTTFQDLWQIDENHDLKPNNDIVKSCN